MDLEWLHALYALARNGETDQAVDLLFDRIDDLLLAGDFASCDDLLCAIDPKQLDKHLMVSVLAITESAAGELPYRAVLANHMKEWCAQ